MINYYKKSEEAFKKYIKENPYCTQKEWDNYAHQNCLFSAFTIECHEIDNNTLRLLIKEERDRFEFLKQSFVIFQNLKIYYLKRLIKQKKKGIKENG